MYAVLHKYFPRLDRLFYFSKIHPHVTDAMVEEHKQCLLRLFLGVDTSIFDRDCMCGLDVYNGDVGTCGSTTCRAKTPRVTGSGGQESAADEGIFQGNLNENDSEGDGLTNSRGDKENENESQKH